MSTPKWLRIILICLSKKNKTRQDVYTKKKIFGQHVYTKKMKLDNMSTPKKLNFHKEMYRNVPNDTFYQHTTQPV